MAKWFTSTGYNRAVSYLAGLTRFEVLAGALDSWANTDEVRCQVKVRTAFNVSDMAVQVTAHGAGSSSTVTFRRSAGDTALAVTIPASTTGLFESATSISLADGDLVDTKVTAGPNLSLAFISYIVEDPATDHFLLVAAGVTSNFSALRSAPVMGDFNTASTATETNVRYTVGAGFTVSKLRTYIWGNNRNGTSTINLRINAIIVNQVLSIPASTTGEFEDTTHSDVVAPGKGISYRIAPGGTTGSLQLSVLQMEGTGAPCPVGSAGSFGLATLVGDRYQPPEAEMVAGTDLAEASVQVKARTTLAFGRIACVVSSNSSTLSSSLALRVNGLDTGLLITIPASTSGAFTTLSDVSIAPTDLINLRFGHQNLQSTTISLEVLDQAPPPVAAKKARTIGYGWLARKEY